MRIFIIFLLVLFLSVALLLRKTYLFKSRRYYPNQALTIVFWEETRKKFEKSPEELFADKNVCVTGRVELFKEKPQIVVTSVSHLALE